MPRSPHTFPDSTQKLREIPSYGIAEAAHYLRIPVSTLQSWILGRPYPTRAGVRRFKPLIEVPPRTGRRSLLSFMNLVEAHVLSAIRRDHDIALPNVRKALDYLQKEFPSKHPLAEKSFETDGIDLFIQEYGQLINISKSGQLAVRQLLEAHLSRIERDPSGVPIKLYPFTRKPQAGEPKVVVIDPELAFGRPVLASTGIPTAMIADRLKAGESVEELAADYHRTPEEIVDAIRCELPAAA